MSCLYKILGVARTASKIEIKQAYRKLAVQYHPDKHTQSPPQTRAAAIEKFKQITNAYETLVDDRKRATYDLRPNETDYRQHKRHDHSNAGQSRQSNRRSGADTKSSADGQGEAKSPNADQYRQSDYLKRRAGATLKLLRRVCVEFMWFTVKTIVEIVVRAFISIFLQILIYIIEALLQPKSKDEEKKK